MARPPRDVIDQEAVPHRQLPSIPILGCRWGLGEGVSPMVFQPLAIPRHLLRPADGQLPEPGRRPLGRGRACGLSGHDDPLPVPGDLANIGVSNLTIQEQINRVRRDLPIYEPPTNYSQYILPRRRSLDEDSFEQEPDAGDAPPPRLQIRMDRSERGGWNLAEFLDPGGAVASVEPALLPSAMAKSGDLKMSTTEPYRAFGNDSDDPDICEERTNSSDTSDEWRARRAWRPRPPPLNEQSFPPLPGAASAADRCKSPARAASGQRVAAAGGSPAGKSRKRAGKGGKTSSQSPAATSTRVAAGRGAQTEPIPAAESRAAGEGDEVAVGATEDAQPSGRVLVTGVTDHNWGEVQEYVQEYGTIEAPQRGPGDRGWFCISPADRAEWIVSVHKAAQCDIAGVAFHLASWGDATDLAAPSSRPDSQE